MTRIFDITPPITADLQVWPGDTPTSREVLLDMGRGDNLTLSTLHATVHLGAHADGPSHYGLNAPAIDERDLDYYVGPCQVMHVSVAPRQRISRSELTERVSMERVLLGTGTFPDPESWNSDFAGLDPDLVDHLHDLGVRLIGVDTPSVDLFDSKDLPAHHRFLANDMAILEGLVLADVPAGIYELIALPLKLVGFEASPVRAILRD